MSYELIEGTNWKCTLKFTVEADQVEEKYAASLKQASKLISLPGFRAGRVPLQIVEKRLRPQIVEDTVMNVQVDAFEEAVKEGKISVLGRPKFTEVAPYEKGSPYCFSADFEIEPRFELPEFKGIKLERHRITVKDDEVDAELMSLRFKNAHWVKQEGRKAEMRDAIYANVTVHHEGVEIAKLENHRFTLTTASLPEFEIEDIMAMFTGVSTGDEREVLAKLTKKFEDGSKAGEEATINFTILSVDPLDMPEIDDNYAKELGFENTDDLKADLKSRIEAYRMQREEERFRASVMATITKDMSFPLPEELLAKQAAANYSRARMRYMRMGIDIESFQDGQHADMLKDSAYTDAERGMKEFFTIEKIAEAEKIFATESEVAYEIEHLAHTQNTSASKLRQSLDKEGMIDQLRWDVLERKVVNYIIARAVIEEIDAPAPDMPSQDEHVHGEDCGCDEHVHDEDCGCDEHDTEKS